jgi:hypothetical protein
MRVYIRVADPYSFDTDPDPGVLMTKNRKKVIAGKTTIYLSLGLQKGRSSYKRSLLLSK